ncbi:MAG: hypothetical protein ACRENA_08130 [Vulcanimicrobiaceae bacterium]
MRKIFSAMLLVLALIVPGRCASARQTAGMFSVSASVASSCLMNPASTSPVQCVNGTNVVMTIGPMSLADVGKLLAANGISQIGLGDSHTSWKLVTVSL